MAKLLYILFTLVFLCTISADALKCFVCEDCPLPDYSYTEDCEIESITTITTAAPANSNTNSETEPITNTTAPPSNSTTDSETESNNEPPTNKPVSNTTPGTESGTDEKSVDDPPDKRKKRLLQNGSASDRKCICKDGICNCNVRNGTISTDDNSTTATGKFKCQCYKHKYEKDYIKVDRGWRRVPEGSNACKVLNLTVNKDCWYCNTDRCNSASPIQPITLILFFISIFQLKMPISV